MDYKLLYSKAQQWRLSPSAKYVVYDVNTTNVVRLLMKTNTITIGVALFSVSGNSVMVQYGTNTITTRLIDAIYVIDKLLHNNYTLKQVEPNLPNIIGDIQRKIFAESGAIKQAQKITSTLRWLLISSS